MFRVPLMNLLHGGMAALMLARAADFKNEERRAAFAGVFKTLVFAIGLKMDFEAVGICLLAEPALNAVYGGWCAAATLLSITLGLGLALLRSRQAPLPWPELHLRTGDKIALAALFGVYLLVVIWTWILISFL